MPKSSKHAKHAPAGQAARSRIEKACRQAVLGKLAVRDLARWVAGVGVSEIEFRMLWLLFMATETPRRSAPPLFDQAELAVRLAVSAAQVSGVVERLRQQGLVQCGLHPGDRRRQLWQLTSAGRVLVVNVVATVDALPHAGDAAKDAA